MAITWTVDIEPIDKATLAVSIIAIGTDSETGIPITVFIPKCNIATAEQKLAVRDVIQAKYAAIIALNASDVAWLEEKETLLKNALEA